MRKRARCPCLRPRLRLAAHLVWSRLRSCRRERRRTGGGLSAARWHTPSRCSRSHAAPVGDFFRPQRGMRIWIRVSRGQLRIAALRNPLRVLPPSQRNITQQPKDSWGIYFGENGGRKAPFENAEVRNSRFNARRDYADARSQPKTFRLCSLLRVRLHRVVVGKLKCLNCIPSRAAFNTESAFGRIPSERKNAKCQPSRNRSLWGSVWVYCLEKLRMWVCYDDTFSNRDVPGVNCVVMSSWVPGARERTRLSVITVSWWRGSLA